MPVLNHDQALAIKTRFETTVLKLPGVTGVDLGLRQAAAARSPGELAIRVYVAAQAQAPQLPAEVEGLAVEVVERRFGLQ